MGGTTDPGKIPSTNLASTFNLFLTYCWDRVAIIRFKPHLHVAPIRSRFTYCDLVQTAGRGTIRRAGCTGTTVGSGVPRRELGIPLKVSIFIFSIFFFIFKGNPVLSDQGASDSASRWQWCGMGEEDVGVEV